VITIVLFNSSVLSRYISKRSLLGGDHHHHHHHHEEPAGVYLPPPSEEEAVAEVTEKLVEITTTVPIVKPAETYLSEEETTSDGNSVSDVVDFKADEEPAVTEAAAIEPADTYIVETEAPVVETEAPAEETTVAAIKAAESYIVETEAPVVETEDGTEEPVVEIADTYLVEEEEVALVEATKPAETYLVEEEAKTEEHLSETEAPVVETEASNTEAPVAEIAEAYLVGDEPEAVKPAETYLVGEEITNEDDGTDFNTEAPAIEAADVYLVPVESSSDVKQEDKTESVNAGSGISSEANTDLENAAQDEAIEPVINSVEPNIVKETQAEGYWIEVSGDRDVLVKYHS